MTFLGIPILSYVFLAICLLIIVWLEVLTKRLPNPITAKDIEKVRVYFELQIIGSIAAIVFFFLTILSALM